MGRDGYNACPLSQVVRRYKRAPTAGVVVRAQAESKTQWQGCIATLVARRSAADAKKLTGNSLFQKKRYGDAHAMYSDAVSGRL
eukprot:SAG22_NODE_8964_length_618_cov_1.094412_1_plen_84_part_00